MLRCNKRSIEVQIRLVTLTLVLVLQDGVHGFQQGPQKTVIGIVGQKERR